jgi:hypothetical protein
MLKEAFNEDLSPEAAETDAKRLIDFFLTLAEGRQRIKREEN